MTRRPDDKSLANPDPTQTPGASRRAEIAPTSTSAEINAFLSEVKRLTPATGTGLRGRLIFALDATASREPTWDRACRIQGEMFEATAALGGLDVKLVYYRGFQECKASRWMANAADLHRAMRAVSCCRHRTAKSKPPATGRR